MTSMATFCRQMMLHIIGLNLPDECNNLQIGCTEQDAYQRYSIFCDLSHHFVSM